ncbi:P-loop containing nucleoside triphosphate hydrolase protein [Auriculariales sp. MPI-PUGE-AT-0066]|nr:P-loop containing nucleoside triphosphate hydrolase protein [Auriculariales sp. MPI-PUGE-AT-0066]
MSRRVCDFYSKPGGCRQGTRCTFAHIGPNGGQSSVTASSSSAAISSPSLPPVPNNVCRYFWQSGTCRFGAGCRYRHHRRHDEQPSSPAGAARKAVVVQQAALPLAYGAGSDFANPPTQQLTPQMAHQYLAPVLRPNTVLSESPRIYSFLNVLTSAVEGSDFWLLLDAVAANDGLGLARIRDIICFSDVTTNAGTNRNKLSFQRGYIRVFAYLSSDSVLKSTLNHRVNALYGVVHNNFTVIYNTIERCMQEMMKRKTFADPLQPSHEYPGTMIFHNLIISQLEYITRFKQAISQNPEVVELTRKTDEWARIWIRGICSTPAEFTDSITKLPKETVTFHVRSIETRLEKLVKIVDREQKKAVRAAMSPSARPTARESEGILAALESTYEGPGALRRDGPRHDNDKIEIADIRIAPTHEELVCTIHPFLPTCLPSAPHPLPPHSMERLLDVQFRLLREELTASLRVAVQQVLNDLNVRPRHETQLAKLLKNKGGRYRTEEVIFSIYTGVSFTGMNSGWRGLSAAVTFDAPPGTARSSSGSARENYWSSGASKRLMQGGLVAIIFIAGEDIVIHLATISGSAKETAASAKADKNRVRTSLSFSTRMRQRTPERNNEQVLMLEAPVLFESIRPFLEALRSEPTMFPFDQYLVHGQQPPEMIPPAYSLRPGFRFNLSSLLKPDEHASQGSLTLSVTDPASVVFSREQLQARSFLDPSQSTALVDCLTRSVGMIQGPPGTGKTFLGIQLLRVLVQHVKPILMIAFTNHALDHLLEAVLDAKITNNIVRLGSRASERLSDYSLENLEFVARDNSRLDKSKRQESYQLKILGKQLAALVQSIADQQVTDEEFEQHMSMAWPEHWASLQSPPDWVRYLYDEYFQDMAAGWQHQGKANTTHQTLLGFWLDNSDMAIHKLPHHIEQVNAVPVASGSQPSSNRFDVLASTVTLEDGGQDTVNENDTTSALSSEEDLMGIHDLDEAWINIPEQQKHDQTGPSRSVTETTVPQDPSLPDIQPDNPKPPATLPDFFARFNMPIPPIPSSDRPVDELRDELDVWSMSETERQQLYQFWREEAAQLYYTTRVAQFENLRKQLAETQQRHDALRDQGLAPRIVLVEEAGQVLEAHSALVPSVEHLICIGDPLQLRPTINNYALSMDSRSGQQLYRFDMSLMERLSQAGMPMSQLNVQRRMRPEIADLIRNPILYSKLQDNDHVKNYPDVVGMGKNVFFMTHNHPEHGGGEDNVSKHNPFEVAMIVDLASYLIRQIPEYSEAGSIVVLCAYLGQLVKLREAFSTLFTVVIDERDQALLADHESEDTEDHTETSRNAPHLDRVKMSQRILLRTVDNFQGEEATIILLSLVRNTGELSDGSRSTIGFLKSVNRTNVALSRAKHGLYILDNSANLASQSNLWETVIDTLYQQDGIGPGFPIVCERHKDLPPRVAAQPGDLQNFAPDGGCLYSCDARLDCGHGCPYKCHADWTHAAVECMRDCQRLCSRDHPCDKLCSQLCGDCCFPVPRVELPCGHIERQVPCFQVDDLDKVRCGVKVLKALPRCEHSAMMNCSSRPEDWVCREMCGQPATCGHVCKARCYDCQQRNIKPQDDAAEHVELAVRIRRENHVPHRCGRMLFCQHPCSEDCGDSEQHKCTTNCKAACRQVCSHFSCKKLCGVPCEPCKEDCVWTCPHYTCPVPCGSPCARLPCDVPCAKVLTCGHPCPSVCGEICEEQVCPSCTKEEDADVVDFILQRRLNEVDPSAGTLDEMLITLKCGHCFTAETLDGHCELGQFYTQEADGAWIAPCMPSTSGFRQPPTCPTCRAPVTARRYSRAVKRADLDVVERNVAGSMATRLDVLNAELMLVDTEASRKALDQQSRQIQAVRDKDLDITPVKRAKMRDEMKRHVGKHKDDIPPLVAVAIANMGLIFQLPQQEKKAWLTVANPIIRLYVRAVDIAATRFAHSAAWEASFAALYRTELQTAAWQPHPEAHALARAMEKIAQPRPRADTRYATEALWQSIQLRFTIVNLARYWLEAIEATDQPNRLAVWVAYCVFVLKTAGKDAENALAGSRKAESHRQTLQSHLFILKVKFELTSINLWMSQKKILDVVARDNLINEVQSRNQDAEATIQAALTEYRQSRERTDEDEQWIADNFVQAADKILEAWQSVEDALRKGLDQPLSREDKIMIIRSLQLSHVGHFYMCPNGHTYVIGECGGAMQASSCPECGARIGGGGHTLDSTNRVDDEMVALAREAGQGGNPWQWGGH